MKFDNRGFARINISASGDNTVISAPGTGNIIEIDHLNFMVTNVAATVTLKDGTSTTLADYQLPINSTFVFDNENPSMNTITLSSGNAFIINSDVASTIKGFVLYRTVNL